MSNDFDLRRRLRSLSQQGLEPGRDLWPEIAGALGEWRRARRTRRLKLLAAAVLLALAGTASVRLLAPRDRLPSGAHTSLPAGSSESLRQAYLAYSAARRQLLREIDNELRSAAPEVRHEIEQSFAVIDAAIDRLQGSPATRALDRGTERDLVALYEHQLKVLQTVESRLQGIDVRQN